MSQEFKILLIQQSEELKPKIEEILGDNLIRQFFDDTEIDELPDDTDMIAIYFKNVDQNLTHFLRKIKTSKFANVPIIALMDKIEESFTKNILKLGFSNFMSLDYSNEVICENMLFYVENASHKKQIFSQISVALIDDDFLHNELIKRMLEVSGVTKVQLFQSSEEYMSKALPFDLFLVDLVMKKSNGIELIKKISNLYPKALIFIVSSLSEDRIVATAYDAGADDFIFKPIKPSVFLAKIFARVRKRDFYENEVNMSK
ncbi:MAG: response regulator [Bacteroidales bacterium]|nr:response regulator [Bacteroidales bacterium]